MVVQHNEPAWRHKADFAIGAKIKDKVWSKKYDWEQLAACELENGLFEICCIPFMVYDICLGDIVSLDEELNVKNVEKWSGHFGFRVVTRDSRLQKLVVNEMRNIGQLTEVWSHKLCAIDAEDKNTAQHIAAILTKKERTGDIVAYDTIRTQKNR